MAADYRDCPLGEFLEALATRSPAPGGGVAAAVTVAIAAGLVAMAASYSDELPDELANRARRLQVRAVELAHEDAAAYAAVLDARSSGEDGALRDAWRRAISVPLEIAECGARTAEDAVTIAEHGRAALGGEAFAGAVLAEAAVRAAVQLVDLNVAAAGAAQQNVAHARALAEDAAISLRRVTESGTHG